jgi:hypothetical protein
VPRYAVLSPIKRNRRVIKSGFVTMSTEAAEALVKAGTLAPVAERADGSDVAVAPAIENLITRAKEGDGDAIMALGALAQKVHDESQPADGSTQTGALTAAGQDSAEVSAPATPATEPAKPTKLPKAPKAPKAAKPKATKTPAA